MELSDADAKELLILVVGKLAEIKATQEIILKTQAHFMAGEQEGAWKGIFDDLRKQAAEASIVYQEQLLNELAVLRQKPKGRTEN